MEIWYRPRTDTLGILHSNTLKWGVLMDIGTPGSLLIVYADEWVYIGSVL